LQKNKSRAKTDGTERIRQKRNASHHGSPNGADFIQTPQSASAVGECIPSDQSTRPDLAVNCDARFSLESLGCVIAQGPDRGGGATGPRPTSPPRTLLVSWCGGVLSESDRAEEPCTALEIAHFSRFHTSWPVFARLRRVSRMGGLRTRQAYSDLYQNWV